MIRCKLGNLPNFLWGEVVTTTIYITNRYAMKVVEGKTPYEAWIRNKPNIYHFRGFGCDAYAFVIYKKLIMLDKRYKNPSLWTMIINIETIGSTFLPL